MTTMTLSGIGDRPALARALNRSLAGSSLRFGVVGTAIGDMAVAVAGAGGSANIDTSALSRRDLSSLVRVLDGLEGPSAAHKGALRDFTRAVEDADRTANPNGPPLRDL